MKHATPYDLGHFTTTFKISDIVECRFCELRSTYVQPRMGLEHISSFHKM